MDLRKLYNGGKKDSLKTESVEMPCLGPEGGN